MDLRKTALIAAITLGLVRAHWVAGQVWALGAMPAFRWIFVPQLAVNSLFLLPLPVLLVVLYRSEAVLPVSKNLRYMALATALVQGVVLTAPGVYGWIMELYRNWANVRLFGEATLAANFWGWFQTPDLGTLAWDTLAVVSQLAFFLFLVALSRRVQGPSIAGAPQLRLTRKVAYIAVFAAGLVVAINIGQQVYAATEFERRPREAVWLRTVTRGQFILRNALSGIPNLCWAIAPLIIFKSIAKE
jgi:hypothetical protein